MTFDNAPLSIDGATLKSSMIRRGTFAAMGGVGAEGIVERLDLKVTQLASPGNGLLIAPGNAVLLNRYQGVPNESYVASNPAVHTVLSTAMPTSQPSAKSYLVLVTIGDPEFSQAGHPWMPTTIDPADRADFLYVRTWFLEVAGGTTSFDGLGLSYPAYAVARLDVPANTTTYTNAMLTDLRAMARPRSSEEVFIANSAPVDTLDTVTPAYETWPNQTYQVKIPRWATTAKITGYIEGAQWTKLTNGHIRYTLVGVGSTADIPFNRSAPPTADRTGMNLGGTVNVSAAAGTTKSLITEGHVISSGHAGGLATDGSTATMIRVRFEEAPV